MKEGINQVSIEDLKVPGLFDRLLERVDDAVAHRYRCYIGQVLGHGATRHSQAVAVDHLVVQEISTRESERVRERE